MQDSSPSWKDVARIDRAFGLGSDDATQRVGSRKLVTALLEQLKQLRDEEGRSPQLRLRARLGICRIPEELPFVTIELLLPLGSDKAGQRLGLREMVAKILEQLQQHRELGGSQEFSLDAHTRIEQRVDCPSE